MRFLPLRWLGCILLSAPHLFASPQAEASFVDASLYFEEQLLSAEFVDLDRNPSTPQSLVVAIRDRVRQTRELRIHNLDAEGRLEPRPARTYPVLDDVFAWTEADVRDEAGREILFLTTGGAFSLSPTREGLRGNVARLISSETLYSVPDARGLSHWKYVLPPAEGAANEARGKERILLPGPNALTIFAFAPQSPQETPDPKRATYAPELVLGAEATGRDSADEVAAERKIEMGNSRMRMSFNVELESTGFVFEETDSFSNTLFDVSASLPAPGLADLDGDRRTDLLLRDKKELRVHFADRATFRSTPDLVNALPSAITDADGDKSFLLRDLEGDGDDDLVVLVEVEDGDSFENHEWRFMVWRNEGGQLFSDNSEQDSPDVLMRFEGSRVSMRLVDVTGDGRLDLFLREVKLPSKLAVATGFKFTLTSLIFEGNDSGFARRPLLKQSRVFDENTLASAIAQRVMNSDLSGDGVADLVEIDLAGRIAIRRLVKTKKFFGGTSWELEESPWKRFDVRGTVVDLSVEDVNGDGLGDILSVSEDRLVLLLSNPSKNRSSR